MQLQIELCVQLLSFFKIISPLFSIQGLHVQVCYTDILHDAEVWGVNNPITQVVNIVPDRTGNFSDLSFLPLSFL